MELNKTYFDDTLKYLIEEYNKGFIASERHLQALIYIKLSSLLEENGFRLIVEPKMETKPTSNISGLIPDMLIINSKNEICGLVEIKYAPNEYIRYDKDFETFKKFHELKESKSETSIFLKVDTKTGDWDRNVLF